VRILVAPDSFKGTYTALEVAEHIGRGIEDEGGVAVPFPVADGGEGTFDALCSILEATPVTVKVQDAWGNPCNAILGLAADGTAIIEVSQASGLKSDRINPSDALEASTYGTGLLVVEALKRGAKNILVAAGGSATTDGGVGAVRAIEHFDGIGDTRITVLSDVTTNFLDAAKTFGPQKGADSVTIALMEQRLREIASQYPRDPSHVPRTGAAGGLSGGLWACFKADLISGAEAVLDAMEFDDQLATVDAVVVGEGRLDSQTEDGKIISAILTRVKQSGRRIPVIAVVGSVSEDLGQYAGNFAQILVASNGDAMHAAGRSLTKHMNSIA
jgi:glycerate kinase